MSAIDTRGWYPIAASDDLPYRHVYHGELWGHEFAVWRADDDFVNVWENRCLHRGVRLTIGANLGGELRCRYHGWRYASRSAGCTYIPAHPADAPARTICNRTYPCAERYGLVWASLDGDAAVADIDALSEGTPLPLRAIAVNAAPERVLSALADYRFPGTSVDAARSAQLIGPHALLACAPAGEQLALFVQPVDAGRAVIRGVLAKAPAPADQPTVLRAHDRQLCALRDALEASQSSAPESLRRDPVPAPHAAPPPEAHVGRHAPLRVQVTDKRLVATDVMRFTLAPVSGVLPAVQPGAHIDVHLPNGLIRQYSITNGPQTSDAYVIGVKREPDSRGGSVCLHDSVAIGDVLALSEPLNNFPLRRDSLRTVLIAGGIGLTPLLAMARTLADSALPFELHHFARDAEHAAFVEEVGALGDAAQVHLGLEPRETTATIAEVLGTYAEHTHAYVCGPGPMIAGTLEVASSLGWPRDTVHYEHFKNDQPIDSSSGFDIALARSGVTLNVPAGKTIVEVLRANGIGLMTSCEQGACGTCKVAVIDGEPLHQDVYLTPAERDGGQVIMACVSRSRSARLILDL